MDYNEKMDMIEENHEEVEQQDQPLFVCKTDLDITLQGEGSQAIMGKANLGTSLAMYGMCLVVGVYLIADSILKNRWQNNAFMLILVGAITIFAIISRKKAPTRALNQWEQAIIQRYNSPILHVTTEFYPLSLVQTIEEDEEQIVFDGYSSITEMVETENLFMLRHGKTQYYFVSKKGFVRGTADAFRTFIQERIGGK